MKDARTYEIMKPEDGVLKDARTYEIMKPEDVGQSVSILQHAVLVNARLVREGVAADNRLVGLDRFAGNRREQLARGEQGLRLDTGVVGPVHLEPAALVDYQR